MSRDSEGFVTSCWERGGMIICYFPSPENFILCEEENEFFIARNKYSCFVWTVMEEETGVGCLMLNS